MTQEEISLGLLWYVAFLFSLTCHEAAHALVAMWGGDKTAFEGGQVSLNPIPHIQRAPFGTIVVPLITYILPPHFMLGWANAPYDPYWQERHVRRAAWMALAGPAANFLIVLASAAAIHAGIAMGQLEQPEYANFTTVVASAKPGLPQACAAMLSILFSLNVLLGAFNLLPLPPLDGSSAIGLLLPERVALQFASMSQNRNFAVIGMILAWQMFDRIFNPIFTFALNMLYFGSHYS